MRIQSAASASCLSLFLIVAGCGGGGGTTQGEGGAGGTGHAGSGGRATGGAGGRGLGGAPGTGGTAGDGVGGAAATGGAAGADAGDGTGGGVVTGTGGAAGAATGGAAGNAGAAGNGGAAGVDGLAGAPGTGGVAGGGGMGGAAVDHCAAHPCDANAACTNTATSYTCACNSSYFGDGATCTACATCAAGTFQTAACAAGHDTVCGACTVCGAGQYQSAACGATADAVCAGCDVDCAACSGIGACTVCAAGHYLNNGVCVACGTCGAGEYQAAACSATADTVCVACSTCGAGQYLSAACGPTNDTTCMTCSACGAGTYETGACTGSTDRTCSACATCGAGQFQTAVCTVTSNRVCASCTTCGAGQYQAAACSPTSDTSCATCTTCGAGQYQTAACGPTSDTACATCGTCGAGQYLATACTANANASCGTCSNCPTGKYVATACGGSNDATCAACDANCDACSGAGACTTCSSGYGLNGGTCVVAGTTCLAIHTAKPTAPSGVYLLDPNGGSPANSFLAYCDMTADGGGWMKILQIHDAQYTPTAAAIGNIAVADTGAMAKLADANINSLTALAAYREYRFQGDLSTKKLFVESSATWDDTARGEGLVLTGTTLACESTTNCTYVTVTAPGGRPTIDSNDWSPSSIAGANNQDRYFTDYSATTNCYATGSTTQRCYDAGASTGHAMIPNLSIWVREAPLPTGALIIYPLDEGSGTAVGDTSGSGNGAAVIQGSWTTSGHTGSALLGALRTSASVPVTNAVTVSVWVRRDGTGSAYPRILGWNNDGFELADAASSNNLGVYTPGLGWHATGVPFGSGYHHVAASVGSGTLTVYFDGSPVYSAATTVNLSGQMSIGTRYNNVESWVGAVDQVRVYGRVLTASEIWGLAHE